MFFKKLRFRKKVNILKSYINTLLVLIAAVMIWRSIWNFADRYFFPDNFILSNLITLLVWFLIILLSDYDLDDVV